MLASAAEFQRPHAYAFDQPELVSAQRVFGIGNATVMLGEACHAFPEAVAGYQSWLDRNQETFKSLTITLATHYRIDLAVADLRQRVAAAMHLKTALDLSSTTLEEACPTLPETLASRHFDLQQRYRDTLKEVQDPNYLNPKRKAASVSGGAPMEQTP